MKRKATDEGVEGSGVVNGPKRLMTDFLEPQQPKAHEHEPQRQLELQVQAQEDTDKDKDKETESNNNTEVASVFSAADSTHTFTTIFQPTTSQVQTFAPASSVVPSSPASRSSRRFPSDLKTIKCTFAGCEKTFNRPARLAAHLRSHTNDRPHRCTYPGCGKDYLEEKHLKQHIKGSHTHERNHVCTEPGCNKSFVTATRLRRHAAVHEGAERYRCRDYDGCSQSFRKHQTLQRHIRVAHLGQSAYICANEGCNAGFDTAGALRRHVNREHGDLKFWCDECSKTDEDGEEGGEGRRVGFTTMLLLQAHMKREHIDCMFCDIRCGSQADLERHIDIYHSGTTVEDRKTVPCIIEGCDRKFTRTNNMNQHVKTAHGGHRWVCGEVNTSDTPDIADWNWQEEGCRTQFMSKAKLEEHVRYVHLGRRRPEKLHPVPPPAGTIVVPDEVVTARTLVCSVVGCEARFIRYYDLNKHIEKEHAYSEPGMNTAASGYGEVQQQPVLETIQEASQQHATADEAAAEMVSAVAAPAVATLVAPATEALAIDPSLEQLVTATRQEDDTPVRSNNESNSIFNFRNGPEEELWLEAGGNHFVLEDQAALEAAEWAEMRRLIDAERSL